MRYRSNKVLAAMLLVVLLLGGCVGGVHRPPADRTELQAYFAEGGGGWGLGEIIAFNLDRVADEKLSERQRIASLALVIHLEGLTPPAMSRLSALAGDAAVSAGVRAALIGVLAANDHPGIEPLVAANLDGEADSRLRHTLLDWVTRHPSPTLLEPVTAAWALSDPADEASEKRFRRAVETLACRTWPDALLEAINAERFGRRSSALAVLASRLSDAQLIERIETVLPRSHAMSALRFYALELGSVPEPEGFYAAVMAYVSERQALVAVAGLVRQWGAQEGYRFSASDLHLLRMLTSEPREIPERAALSERLVDRLDLAGQSPGGERIAASLADLDRADLHRVELLLDWLGDPATRSSLRLTAQRDAADVSSRWGGLIFLRGGGAEALLYPPAERLSDRRYLPSERFVHDAADCLCWFACRFNPDFDGHSDGLLPDAEELSLAGRLLLPGVALSRMGPDHVAVVFFTEDGRTLSLGAFQFAL